MKKKFILMTVIAVLITTLVAVIPIGSVFAVDSVAGNSEGRRYWANVTGLKSHSQFITGKARLRTAQTIFTPQESLSRFRPRKAVRTWPVQTQTRLIRDKRISPIVSK